MIDPAGLTLGIAGLFSTVVEVIDRISAAKSYGDDYQLFVTKVATERLRLSRWGQAVGLARDGVSFQQHDSRIQQHEILQDLEVRNAVTELLAWAVRYFEDAEGVLKRNTARKRGFITFLPGRNALALSTAGLTVSAFKYPRTRARTFQKEASALGKMKWALSGKRKSEKILQGLSWFVDKLHELVPTSAIQQVVLSPAILELAPTSAIPLAPTEPLALPPTMRLLGRHSRIEHRKSASTLAFRRMRKNHIRLVAAGAAVDENLRAAEADKKAAEIRVDERYVVIFSWLFSRAQEPLGLVIDTLPTETACDQATCSYSQYG